MVYINLLPVREIKGRLRSRRLFFTFIGMICSFLTLLALIGFVQAGRARQLASEVAGLQQEKQRYNSKVVQEIKALEKDKEQLETQIGVINRLKKKSSLTVHILDEVASIIAGDRMWLTSLAQQGNSLTLQGMALDNRTIAQFMDDLKRSPYIGSVSLSSSALKQYAGRNLKSFSLSCITAIPGQEQEDTDKKSSPGSAH